MKILICDDEQKYIDELKGYVTEYMQRNASDFVIDTALDPQEVIESGKVYHLAFLDIQMQSANGIELAKILKQRNSKVIIFFVTSFNDYLDESMDIRAFRFFEKPINPERLYSGLDKAMEYIDESYIDFWLSNGEGHMRILVDDVCYIERVNRKVNLVTKQGSFRTKESFEEWAAIFQNTFFFQVHKSYIINLHYVTAYKYTELYLNETVRIPIATRRQSDFRKFWFDYVKRR